MLLVVLLVSACETVQQAQITELAREGRDVPVLLMPPDVELSELTAGGVREPNAEWTRAALRHMKQALEEETRAANIKFVDFQPSNDEDPSREDEVQVIKLHGAVGNSILVHQYIERFRLPTKEAKFDWSLGPAVRSLRERFDADYALFVFVRDSYSTAGRVVLQVFAALFGVAVPGGAQVGFASLVDLDTGDIVWFNSLARGAGDLRTPGPARETVKKLLTNMPK